MEIAVATAMSVELENGDIVRCITGQIWLTQENDSRDYCLVAGVSFRADRPGRAVLTALDERSTVWVEHREGARSAGAMLKVEAWDAIRHRARQAQAEWIAASFAWALRWLRMQIARLHRLNRNRPRPI